MCSSMNPLVILLSVHWSIVIWNHFLIVIWSSSSSIRHFLSIDWSWSLEENSLFAYRWLLLDCKREFHRFCLNLFDASFLFFSSINNEWSRIISNHFVNINFPRRSSSSRSSQSTRRTFQQAQMVYFNYTSSVKSNLLFRLKPIYISISILHEK